MTWWRRRLSPRKERDQERAGGLGRGDLARSPETPQGTVPPGKQIQINIRGDRALLERFKALCRAERRTYADMLAILIREYERGRDR